MSSSDAATAEEAVRQGSSSFLEMDVKEHVTLLPSYLGKCINSLSSGMLAVCLSSRKGRERSDGGIGRPYSPLPLNLRRSSDGVWSC